MSAESITQSAQAVSVYREIESARLMDYKEVEDTNRIEQIDNVHEFNALMDAAVLINQGSYFDLYV
jgi:hypothetical protein